MNLEAVFAEEAQTPYRKPKNRAVGQILRENH
jgi:hypothetical protein